MRIYLIAVLSLLAPCCSTYLTSLSLPQWEGEVLHGEHFDDLFVSADGTIFTTNVLLVLHSAPCSDDALRLVETALTEHLPPVNVLVAVHHNYTHFRERCRGWVSITHELDLWSRYGGDRCLHTLFFKRGASPDDAPSEWYGDGHVHLWVWSHLQVTFSVTNEMATPLSVLFDTLGYGPPVAPLDVPQRSTKVVGAYQMTVAAVYTIIDSRRAAKYVDARLLMKPTKIHIKGLSQHTDSHLQRLIDKTTKTVLYEENLYRRWLTAQLRRVFLLLHQPPTLRGASHLLQADVEMLTLDKQIYNKLFNYYVAHNAERKQTVCNKVDEIVSPASPKIFCFNIFVERDLQAILAAHLQDIAEQFCSCKLRLTLLDALTVYNKGNTIYRSVTQADTRVFTVSVQVLADHTAPHWTRLIACPGQLTQRIQLQSGEAVVFTSAMCSDGRPAPLLGNLLVELNAYFVPDRWPITDYKQFTSKIASASPKRRSKTSKQYSKSLNDEL